MPLHVNPPNIADFGGVGRATRPVGQRQPESSTSINAHAVAQIRQAPVLANQRHINVFAIEAETVLHQGYLLLKVEKGLLGPSADECPLGEGR